MLMAKTGNQLISFDSIPEEYQKKQSLTQTFRKYLLNSDDNPKSTAKIS